MMRYETRAQAAANRAGSIRAERLRAERERREREIHRRLAMIIAVAAAVMIGLLLFGRMEVNGTEPAKAEVSAEYLGELERQYLQVVRETLTDAGYSNCGLNLTRSRDAEGVQSYSLRIHHDRFSYLNETQRREILKQVDAVVFTVPGVSCVSSFL